MSIRTEPKDLSAALHQTLTIDPAVMQSAISAAGGGPLMAPAPAGAALPTAADNEQHLGEANSFNTSNPDHPLRRTLVINIRASLADLCLKKQRAVWTPPSADATKAIFQQKKCMFDSTHTPRPPPPSPGPLSSLPSRLAPHAGTGPSHATHTPRARPRHPAS